MPNFAANLTWLFNELNFTERFSAAAGLGFKAVECQFPYQWDTKLLRDDCSSAGQQMIMFNTPPGKLDEGEYGLAALPGRESDFRQSIDLALTYATALNCPMLHMLAGIVPDGASYNEYLETYVKNLAWAAAVCAQNGITVLIEPINTFERPGYLISTTGQAREAIRQCGMDNIAIQFDFHNAQLMEGNLTALLNDNLSYIRHMQIAGVPNRTPPDQGEMNYPYLFDLVDRSGYQGWLGCEFRPGKNTPAGLAWLKQYGLG
jgi:hydroxypyruvate isomerase